ncbi:hypothetical protein [Streptomyces sp. NPDC050738]|uniref:hypothetical protein n=1 Tax=Streptomyces sp. NPDC050738 TaxID=3154744 RepID=UPI00341F4A48
MRRIALATTVVAALALTGVVGCSAVDKAVDCVQTADAVASNVNNLQQAVSNAANDPTQASEALDDITKNLKSLNDKTDDADLSKAIDSLNTAVDNVRSSIKSGDKTPDIGPVADAASELGKVCTS